MGYNLNKWFGKVVVLLKCQIKDRNIMKTTKQHLIDHILKTATRLTPVEIYCGELSKKGIVKIERYFTVEKKLFGYYKFTKRV